MVDIFLDDKRIPPPGFVHVRTVDECKRALMDNSKINILCLDHGMGPGNENGVDLVQWMIRNRIFPQRIYLHSANRMGRRQMYDILKNFLASDDFTHVELYDHPYTEDL